MRLSFLSSATAFFNHLAKSLNSLKKSKNFLFFAFICNQTLHSRSEARNPSHAKNKFFDNICWRNIFNCLKNFKEPFRKLDHVVELNPGLTMKFQLFRFNFRPYRYTQYIFAHNIALKRYAIQR